MKVLVDTNVLLDVIQRRQPFDVVATELWRRVEEGRLDGFVSTITFNNIFYIARKQAGRDRALEAVKLVRRTFKLVPTDERVIDAALSSSLVDFEDGIQAAAASAAGADCIATRDVKDFAGSNIPAYSPGEVLAIVEP